MSEQFHEGDLVEAVKGESVVRGRVKLGTRAHGTEGYKYLGDSGAIKEVYIHDGWTVTVIEKAAPKLPTEPGVYSDKDGTVWRLHFDEWYLIGANDIVHDGGGIVSRYAPFTPLEPASVTAKKVLDAIRQRIGSIDSAHDFQAVATQFGVTE